MNLFPLLELSIGLKFRMLQPEPTFSYVPEKKCKVFLKNSVSDLSDYLPSESVHGHSTLYCVSLIFSISMAFFVQMKGSGNLSPEKASQLSWGISGCNWKDFS